jgi:hypothetical protein
MEMMMRMQKPKSAFEEEKKARHASRAKWEKNDRIF